MLWKVHYFGKRWFFHEIFQVGACPNLKYSSLYDRFSIHMYKAWSIRFLWLFCAICDSLIPSKVHFLEKGEVYMKYFELVHAPTWKIPHYMRGFLFICTRHEAFGIFNIFCAICDSLMLCKVHRFGKRWFFMTYFKLVHAPTWKIPHYMIGFLFIYTRHEAFGIFNFFPLSATP